MQDLLARPDRRERAVNEVHQDRAAPPDREGLPDPADLGVNPENVANPETGERTAETDLRAQLDPEEMPVWRGLPDRRGLLAASDSPGLRVCEASPDRPESLEQQDPPGPAGHVDQGGLRYV